MMSDSEEEPDWGAGGSDFADDEPSTSWGAGRKSGGLKRKRKVLSDSDDEEGGPHSGASAADEETDDDEDDAAGGDPLEGFTHTSSQLTQSMGIVNEEVHGCPFLLLYSNDIFFSFVVVFTHFGWT